ncbi:hypothetical protein [Dysgonomonas macrotermitis]|uniref:Uncharacterized protein n=1 Tax=Dysgonomonas macrotermitis TaxID=1346286 RepID=A0A1M5ASK5_9BACT|nr:hypothetical protein [Dysgonomonas macrotermitis]SHF33213.1 hypothetical protein SAMN05444362_105147 [Dysgonomonas macrotermitis]
MAKLIAFLASMTLFLFAFSQESKTIHVMVALCDNQYQGIVKVPKAIGNGQDPDNNLYWGCGYGIRTYFKKGADWKLIKQYKMQGNIMERIVFKHHTQPYYLVADAYNGKYIKQCTIDYLNSLSGKHTDTIHINKEVVKIQGHSSLLAYIGHNGLMDFSLPDTFKNTDGKKRDAIILACVSKQYFAPYLKSANASPLIWTTNLMCPEAYTLYDAINTYIKGGTQAQVQNSAAAAYSKYQKCSVGAAKRLLVTGW